MPKKNQFTDLGDDETKKKKEAEKKKKPGTIQNNNNNNNNNYTRGSKIVENEPKNVKITDLFPVRDYYNFNDRKDNTLHIRGNQIRDATQNIERSTTINHWSTGGFKVEEILQNSSKKILETYTPEEVFIAKPSDKQFAILTPSRITASEQYKNGYPRTDSEIAFLQHMTQNKLPANLGKDEYIDTFGLANHNLDNGSKLRIKLYIQNSRLPPCTSERPGIKCNDYLPEFLNNLRSKLQTQYPSAEVRLKVSNPNGMSRYGDYNGEKKYNNKYVNIKDKEDIRKIYNQ